MDRESRPRRGSAVTGTALALSMLERCICVWSLNDDAGSFLACPSWGGMHEDAPEYDPHPFSLLTR